MEYVTCLSIPTPDVEFYGMPVGRMVRPMARIQANGIVRGHFPYVTGYTGFDSLNLPLQEGHYFPAVINVSGKELSIVRCKDGKEVKSNMESGDDFVVIKIDENKEFDIKVDGRLICHLDFSEAILEEKRSETMYTKFYDPGNCGLIITGYIGTLRKESGTDATFEHAVPVGTRMVYLVAIPSDDMEGPATISAGNGTKEDIYAKAHAIKKGEGGASHPTLPLITSETVKVKLNTAITKGTIDLYASVVRLEV